MAKSWPRLSQTLPPPESREKCQRCGDRELVQIWQEHDEADRPEPVYVALCKQCSEKIIDPHPRLYARLDCYEPLPGTMHTCTDCTLRKGLTCTSPLLMANGGAGLPVRSPQPTVMFIDGRDPKTGRRFGRREMRYDGPSTCDGKPKE